MVATMFLLGGVGVTAVLIFIGLFVLNILVQVSNFYTYKQQKPMQELQYIPLQSLHFSKCSTQTSDSHNGQCSVYLESRRAGHLQQATTFPVCKDFSRHPGTSLLVNLDTGRH